MALSPLDNKPFMLNPAILEMITKKYKHKSTEEILMILRLIVRLRNPYMLTMEAIHEHMCRLDELKIRHIFNCLFNLFVAPWIVSKSILKQMRKIFHQFDLKNLLSLDTTTGFVEAVFANEMNLFGGVHIIAAVTHVRDASKDFTPYIKLTPVPSLSHAAIRYQYDCILITLTYDNQDDILKAIVRALQIDFVKIIIVIVDFQQITNSLQEVLGTLERVSLDGTDFYKHRSPTMEFIVYKVNSKPNNFIADYHNSAITEPIERFVQLLMKNKINIKKIKKNIFEYFDVKLALKAVIAIVTKIKRQV